MIPVDFVVGLAVGLAVSAGGYLALRLYLLRRQRTAARRMDRSYPAAADLPDLPPMPETPRPRLLGMPVAAAHVAGGSAGPASSAFPASDSFAPVRSSADVPEFRTSVRINVAEPTLQLSHRVVLHIFAHGTLHPGEVAPRSLCQSGMQEALDARQGALAGVLQRLEAAGIVECETGHVREVERRVKFYRLTPRGESLARQLRSRPRDPPPRTPRS